jgi:lycopene cyclase domain-containing protein
MSETLYYLVVDLAALSVPLIFSFHPRLRFYRFYIPFLLGLILTGGFFIIWDVYFTEWGVWGFNDRYLLGIRYFGLPLEEWLFFFCIPYACVFTYKSFEALGRGDLSPQRSRVVLNYLTALSLAMFVLNYDKWYTASTFLFLTLFLLIHKYLLRAEYLGRLFVSYAVCLIPFFIVNGLLTGSWIDEQIVWYNDAENLGFRIGTIPFEDAFYGFLLIAMNITIMEEWIKRKRMTA